MVAPDGGHELDDDGQRREIGIEQVEEVLRRTGVRGGDRGIGPGLGRGLDAERVGGGVMIPADVGGLLCHQRLRSGDDYRGIRLVGDAVNEVADSTTGLEPALGVPRFRPSSP